MFWVGKRKLWLPSALVTAQTIQLGNWHHGSYLQLGAWTCCNGQAEGWWGLCVGNKLWPCHFLGLLVLGYSYVFNGLNLLLLMLDIGNKSLMETGCAVPQLRGTLIPSNMPLVLELPAGCLFPHYIPPTIKIRSKSGQWPLQCWWKQERWASPAPPLLPPSLPLFTCPVSYESK